MKKILLFGALLSALGLLFVYESSAAEALRNAGDPWFYAKQQAIKFGIGFVGLFLTYFIPINWWKKISFGWYLGAVVLLVLVLIPGLGNEFNGARRWLTIPGLGVFQPSEVMKLGLILWFANLLSRKVVVSHWALWTLVPIILIMLQPDLGSALVIIALSVGLYVLAGGSWRWLFLLGGGGVLAISLLIFTSSYRLARVTTFFNPESDPLGKSFHIRQITLALGRGGLFGQGFGNSKQKLAYLPEASSDSIFAIVAEELGFVGSTAILVMYLFFWAGIYQITTKYAEKSFHFLLAGGILIWMATQTILNLASVLAVVPLTGVPLPFFSYGGTALVMVLLATGLVLRLYYEQPQTTTKLLAKR